MEPKTHELEYTYYSKVPWAPDKLEMPTGG